MTHAVVWRHLPDLLGGRGSRWIVAHVRDCRACQHQLSLLRRVDALLSRAPQCTRP